MGLWKLLRHDKVNSWYPLQTKQMVSSTQRSQNWRYCDNCGTTVLSNPIMKIIANTAAHGEPIATPSFSTYAAPLKLN